jgi:uncharacterized protein (DUF362 family)
VAQADPREALAALTCPGGGWGYVPGQPPHLEPTCLALLALAAEPRCVAERIGASRQWLDQCLVADGSYRLARGRPDAVWTTALALFVRASLNDPPDQLTKSAAFLLGIRGKTDNATDGNEVNDVDSSLVGWPWAAGNFSWVEPTAWACLALRRVGQGLHPRVTEGLNLLLDRSFPEGGCNYGNRRILGRALDPIPTPTALMLLALQGRRDEPRIAASVRYLCASARREEDLEHLCWARVALDLYRAEPGVEETITDIGRRIDLAAAVRSETPWVRPAPVRLALAALALDVESRNPFRMPSHLVQRGDLPPANPPAARASLGQRIKGVFQGLALNTASQLRPLGPQTAVHVAPVADYNADLADVVCRQYEEFRGKVPLAGKRVVLKPNLVEYHRDKVINTHPHVIAAVIELCRREGAAEILVAEGPGHWRNAEYLVAASGLGDVLRHHKVRFVDLNHDEPVKRFNLGRLTGLEHLYLSETIATADVVISIPKLKTHHWAVATLSLKNLFGTLPGICYGWPKNELHWRGIDNSIVDIAATRTPDLAIVDGIVGMEGDGPLNGTPRASGVIVMGCDLVAVDATCCRLMQLDPHKVGYLVLGNRKRIGLLEEVNIRQVGESLRDRAQPFATVEHFLPVRLVQPA